MSFYLPYYGLKILITDSSLESHNIISLTASEDKSNKI